jgi:hypothetical protein
MAEAQIQSFTLVLSRRLRATQSVRLYDSKKNALLHSYEHKAAVLDCCFSEDDAVGFSGGLDRSLVMCFNLMASRLC